MHIKIGRLRIGIFTKSQLQSLEGFAISEVDKAIAAAKQTELGMTIAQAIKDIKNQNITGLEKFETVLKDVLPEIQKYATGGGLNAVLSDVEDFGRQLVQSVFNDTLSSRAGNIASAILAFIKTNILK